MITDLLSRRASRAGARGSPGRVLRIEADVLVPGPADQAPVRDGVVVVDGETITYAGPSTQAPPVPPGEPVRAAAVMPGMWDAHVHLGGMLAADRSRIPLEPVALRAARCTADLRRALEAGVTSVRELGGLGVPMARAVAEGSVPGPRVFPAGAMLSPTGGHFDLTDWPLPQMERFCADSGERRLADGEADCVKAVREQLRRNAAVIKVCASGGVMSEVDDPEHQQFTVAELAAMVEAAATAERIVAVHAHGKRGIMAALEAGVGTIEHGTHLDDEAAQAMAETGAVLVPTATFITEVLTEPETLPPHARTKLRAVADVHREAVARAHAHGVRIAAGTDIGRSGGGPASWGHHGHEPSLLTDAGLSPPQAVEAATANGPLTLGPRARRTGRLASGHDADLVTLDADPLDDTGVLADPTHVTGVWIGGERAV